MLRKGTLYVNDVMLGSRPINRIFNKKNIYWGGDSVPQSEHLIWGTVYFNVRVQSFKFNHNPNEIIYSHIDYNDLTYYLDRSDLNDVTIPITSLSGFAAGNGSMVTINLSPSFVRLLTTSRINLSNMFSSCERLKELDLSMLNRTEFLSITDMTQMFNGCSALETLNLHNCLLYSIPMTHAFGYCDSLRDVYINLQDTFDGLTSYQQRADDAYIPSTATIHFTRNGVTNDYVWNGSAWVIE